MSEHNHNHGTLRKGNKNSLRAALFITFGFMIVEALGGWLTNSLALLSDAGHMLSDAGSLALSLFAIWFAAKPPTLSKSYGYHRIEILAALFNGVVLFVVAALIIWEAGNRLLAPPVVASGSMMLVAFFGLLANFACAWVLLKGGDVKNNINMRSAYLHVLSDALGSVGAIAAGLLMKLFSWYIADPIISIVVSLLILKSGWSVIKQALHVLMEGTPKDVDVNAIAAALRGIPGVVDVHDIHVWSVASDKKMFSCHMLVKQGTNSSQTLAQAVPLLEKQFGIRHATIQIVEQDIDTSTWSCKAESCSLTSNDNN